MHYFRPCLFSALSFFHFLPLFSQQDPEIFQFANNRLLYNAAFAGLENKDVITSLYNWSYPPISSPIASDYRRPILLAFSVGIPLVISRSDTTDGGISLGYMENKIGYIHQNSYRIGMNKQIKLAGNFKLRLGAEWLRQHREVYYSKINPNHLDQFDAKSGLNIGVVLANKEWKGFYTGLSISHVTQEKFQYSDSAFRIGTSPLIRHYYIVSGMEFNNVLGINRFHFHPAFLLRCGERSLAMAGNYSALQTTFSYDKKLELGPIIRIDDYTSLKTGVIAGINPLQFFKNTKDKSLRIGYSLTPSYFNQLISGFSYHHEISISFIGTIK